MRKECSFMTVTRIQDSLQRAMEATLSIQWTPNSVPTSASHLFHFFFVPAVIYRAQARPRKLWRARFINSSTRYGATNSTPRTRRPGCGGRKLHARIVHKYVRSCSQILRVRVERAGLRLSFVCRLPAAINALPASLPARAKSNRTQIRLF